MLKVPPIVLLLLFLKGASILLLLLLLGWLLLISWLLLLELIWSDNMLLLIHWLLLWVLVQVQVVILLAGYLGLIVVKDFSIKRWLNVSLSLLMWLQASISSSSIRLRWEWFLLLSSRHLLLQLKGIHPLLLVIRLLTIIFTHLVFKELPFIIWITLLYLHLVWR